MVEGALLVGRCIMVESALGQNLVSQLVVAWVIHKFVSTGLPIHGVQKAQFDRDSILFGCSIMERSEPDHYMGAR